MSFGKNPLTAASVTLFTLLGLLPSVCDAGGGEGEYVVAIECFIMSSPLPFLSPFL